MLRSRSPFAVPHVRKIFNPIETKQKNRQKNMVQMKQQLTCQQSPLQRKVNQQEKYCVLNTQLKERFCIQLQNPIRQNDPIFFQHDLATQLSGNVTKSIIFRNQSYFTRQACENTLYQTIFIVFQNIPGLKDQKQCQTSRMCPLHLIKVVPHGQSPNQVYDLLYQQRQDYQWEIPYGVPKLRLKLQGDGQQLTTSLCVPINLQFQIRHRK